MKNVTDIFKKLEEKRNEVYTKIPENLSEFMVHEKIEKTEDVSLLTNALIEMKKRLEYQKPLHTKITKKEISVEERTSYIREVLTKRNKITFNDLFEVYSKDLIVATFLSVLDMCKNNEICLKQEANFDDIIIEKVVNS